jgi:S1-C subfamily serine protease
MQGLNIKTGIVSKLGIDIPVLDLAEETAVNTIIITVPSIRGDSGGPVFVIADEKFYCIGMIYALTDGAAGYNFAFKSNYLQNIIQKIKTK